MIAGTLGNSIYIVLPLSQLYIIGGRGGANNIEIEDQYSSIKKHTKKTNLSSINKATVQSTTELGLV